MTGSGLVPRIARGRASGRRAFSDYVGVCSPPVQSRKRRNRRLCMSLQDPKRTASGKEFNNERCSHDLSSGSPCRRVTRESRSSSYARPPYREGAWRVCCGLLFQVEADRDTLAGLTERVGGMAGGPKEWAARLTEKVSRVKLKQDTLKICLWPSSRRTRTLPPRAITILSPNSANSH
jgi:hypothetical protein